MNSGTPIKVRSEFAGVIHPSPSIRSQEVRLSPGSVVIWMGSFVSELGVECQILFDPEKGCIYVPGIKCTDVGEIL